MDAGDRTHGSVKRKADVGFFLWGKVGSRASASLHLHVHLAESDSRSRGSPGEADGW